MVCLMIWPYVVIVLNSTQVKHEVDCANHSQKKDSVVSNKHACDRTIQMMLLYKMLLAVLSI